MNLEQITKDIENTTVIATRDVEELPYAVRAAWGVKKVEAAAKLKELKVEHRNYILSNGIAIFLTGDATKVAEFGKFVHDEGEGLVVDASALYERFAKEIEPTLGDQRQWGVAQYYKFNIIIQEVMHELGLTEMPAPTRTNAPVLHTYQDVVAYSRSLIKEAVGDTFNKLYVQEQAVQDALRIRYTNVRVPVIILNAEDNEILGMGNSFTRGHAAVTLSADDEVNKESIVKVFKDVMKKIQGHGKQKQQHTEQGENS